MPTAEATGLRSLASGRRRRRLDSEADPVERPAHGAVGFVLALVLAELAFLSLKRVPFTCSFTSGGNVAGRGLMLGLLVLPAAFIVATVERQVVASLVRFVSFLAVLLGVWTGVVLVGAIRARSDPGPSFDESPDLPTQRLDLAG